MATETHLEYSMPTTNTTGVGVGGGGLLLIMSKLKLNYVTKIVLT